MGKYFIFLGIYFVVGTHFFIPICRDDVSIYIFIFIIRMPQKVVPTVINRSHHFISSPRSSKVSRLLGLRYHLLRFGRFRRCRPMHDQVLLRFHSMNTQNLFFHRVYILSFLYASENLWYLTYSSPLCMLKFMETMLLGHIFSLLVLRDLLMR